MELELIFLVIKGVELYPTAENESETSVKGWTGLVSLELQYHYEVDWAMTGIKGNLVALLCRIHKEPHRIRAVVVNNAILASLAKESEFVWGCTFEQNIQFQSNSIADWSMWGTET